MERKPFNPTVFLRPGMNYARAFAQMVGMLPVAERVSPVGRDSGLRFEEDQKLTGRERKERRARKARNRMARLSRRRNRQ